jgi:hypothetical protein
LLLSASKSSSPAVIAPVMSTAADKVPRKVLRSSTSSVVPLKTMFVVAAVVVLVTVRVPADKVLVPVVRSTVEPEPSMAAAVSTPRSTVPVTVAATSTPRSTVPVTVAAVTGVTGPEDWRA